MKAYANNILLLLLLVAYDSVAGELKLIVPIATTHIEYNDKDYNNNNSGLGIEYTINNRHQFGFLHLQSDSFGNPNNYLYYGRKFQQSRYLSFSTAVFVATNYSAEDQAPIMPLITVEYRGLRIVTSAPLGKLINAGADLVNVQYVVSF